MSGNAFLLHGEKRKTLGFPTLPGKKVTILTPSEEHITKKY
jgi:hypothetical protein